MKNNVHIGNEIRKELGKRKLSIAWLAKEILDDPSNLCKQLGSKFIKHEKLYEISKALRKDFFALYSQQLADEIGL